jgi:hypothetical protein
MPPIDYYREQSAMSADLSYLASYKNVGALFASATRNGIYL